MDRIDAEIMQCCLELKDLFCLGIVFDPKSIAEWKELKRRDSKYSKLCDEEDSTWVGMNVWIRAMSAFHPAPALRTPPCAPASA